MFQFDTKQKVCEIGGMKFEKHGRISHSGMLFSFSEGRQGF